MLKKPHRSDTLRLTLYALKRSEVASGKGIMPKESVREKVIGALVKEFSGRRMPKERIRGHFMNIEIYETWKNYERIAQSFGLSNPLTYEDLRNSFKCYYQGGVYVPEGFRRARMESFFLRFFPENLIKDYSRSIAAPVFGFEWQLRIRLVNVGAVSLPRRFKRIDTEFFNYVWNKTFSKEEQEEIIKVRKLAQKGLVFLSRLSSYFKEYHKFSEKVRDWEEEMVKKGRAY